MYCQHYTLSGITIYSYMMILSPDLLLTHWDMIMCPLPVGIWWSYTWRVLHTTQGLSSRWHPSAHLLIQQINLQREYKSLVSVKQLSQKRVCHERVCHKRVRQMCASNPSIKHECTTHIWWQWLRNGWDMLQEQPLHHTKYPLYNSHAYFYSKCKHGAQFNIAWLINYLPFT